MTSSAMHAVPLGIPLWRPPLPEEPAHGLLLRLCELNGYPFVECVSRETGLSRSRLQHGEQFDLLARIVRCDKAAIARDSFRVEDETFVFVRDQKVGYYRDFDCSRRRVCPTCLAESNHHRFWWDLAFISSCPRHGIQLVERCSCATGGPLGWSDGSLVRGRCCKDGDLRNAAPAKAGDTVLAMDRYLAGRLGLLPPTPIGPLDELSLYDAIDLLERVGALHAGGWSERWSRSSKVGLSPAANRAEAYAIVAGGRMQEVLETVYLGFLKSPLKDNPVLTTAYGWFYHWYNLKGNSRFSRYLTEEIYKHASTRFRIDTRATGNKSGSLSVVTAGQIDRFNVEAMTLVAAKTACGRHLTIVRGLATAYGLMRDEKINGRRVDLRADDVAVMKFLFAREADKEEMAALLGTRGTAMLRLMAVGAVTPFFAVAKTYRFLRDDASDLLARMSAMVDPSHDDGSSICAIGKHGWIGQPPVAMVVQAILEGTIVPVREDPKAVGLLRFHIRKSDVLTVRRAVLASAIVGAPDAAAPAPDFEHWRRRMLQVEGTPEDDQDPSPGPAIAFCDADRSDAADAEGRR